MVGWVVLVDQRRRGRTDEVVLAIAGTETRIVRDRGQVVISELKDGPAAYGR
jgi:hypothetical protein